MSRVWVVILVAFFLIGVITDSPYLVALATAVLIVIGVAYEWQKHSLDGVIYRRRFHYTRGFPGERFPLRMEIENRKLLPIPWLEVQDPWPKAVAPEDESVLAPSHIEDQGLLMNLVSLGWYESARRTYPLLLRKRGIYKVGPAVMESGDLFGIYQKREVVGQAQRLTVFPTLLQLPERHFPAEDPFGERQSKRRLFEDPNRPIGVREYRPEDGFRRVHWPATAHTGQLQVKVYQPVSARVLSICLNISTFSRHWEGYHPGMLEHLASLAGSLAEKGLQEGYQVGLISNGCLANSDQPFRIPPGRSPRQLAALLQALAGVTPIMIGTFEEFLIKEIPHVPYGAMLVIVTAVTSPELAETILRLKRHERKITLVSIAREIPPDIPGVRAIHMPYQDAETGEAG